jgi:hypothetical protein
MNKADITALFNACVPSPPADFCKRVEAQIIERHPMLADHPAIVADMVNQAWADKIRDGE